MRLPESVVGSRPPRTLQRLEREVLLLAARSARTHYRDQTSDILIGKDYDRLRVWSTGSQLPGFEVLRREDLRYEAEGMETSSALARSEAHLTSASRGTIYSIRDLSTVAIMAAVIPHMIWLFSIIMAYPLPKLTKEWQQTCTELEAEASRVRRMATISMLVKASKSEDRSKKLLLSLQLVIEDKTHAYAERQAERKRKVLGPPRCSNCNRVGHLARDCRIRPANNNNNNRNNNNNNNNNNRNNNNNNRNNNNNNQQGNGGNEKEPPAKVYVVGNTGQTQTTSLRVEVQMICTWVLAPDNTGTLSIGASEMKQKLSEQLKKKLFDKVFIRPVPRPWELRPCCVKKKTIITPTLPPRGKANVVCRCFEHERTKNRPIRVQSLSQTISLDLPQTELKCSGHEASKTRDGLRSEDDEGNVAIENA
ncbi:putative reverse transcriptase domain-containing protein [Tanacetum coccineum]